MRRVTLAKVNISKEARKRKGKNISKKAQVAPTLVKKVLVGS